MSMGIKKNRDSYFPNIKWQEFDLRRTRHETRTNTKKRQENRVREILIPSID